VRRRTTDSPFDNPGVLDTLALADHLTGDTTKAVEIQGLALSLLHADLRDRADYDEHMSEFEAALGQSE